MAKEKPNMTLLQRMSHAATTLAIVCTCLLAPLNFMCLARQDICSREMHWLIFSYTLSIELPVLAMAIFMGTTLLFTQYRR